MVSRNTEFGVRGSPEIVGVLGPISFASNSLFDKCHLCDFGHVTPLPFPSFHLIICEIGDNVYLNGTATLPIMCSSNIQQMVKKKRLVREIMYRALC